MIEQVFAAIVLAICLVLVVRLLLSPARRWRFDAAARGWWTRFVQNLRTLWNWRRNRRDAERAARDAINRANQRSGRPDDGNWDGNVYQAKSFRKPRKPH